MQVAGESQWNVQVSSQSQQTCKFLVKVSKICKSSQTQQNVQILIQGQQYMQVPSHAISKTYKLLTKDSKTYKYLAKVSKQLKSTIYANC